MRSALFAANGRETERLERAGQATGGPAGAWSVEGIWSVTAFGTWSVAPVAWDVTYFNMASRAAPTRKRRVVNRRRLGRERGSRLRTRVPTGYARHDRRAAHKAP